MYYDDRFDPNLPNDYDDEDFIGSTNNHVDSNSFMNEDDNTLDSQKRRKNKKKYDELLNVDQGYVKTRIYVGYNKTVLEYYKTKNSPGAKIRNALTGIYENFRVGGKDEDLFFKVVSTITKDPNSESHLLFYDSPEQYEKHFHCEVNANIKQTWIQKSSSARLRVTEEANKKYEREQIFVR